jgi:hypothetical protein
MKGLFLLMMLAINVLLTFSQVYENKSGVLKFNISKKGDAIKMFNDQNRITSDVRGPSISIQSPEFGSDSIYKNSNKTLTVKGKVIDPSGIFEVIVNGVEARVSADGIFLAEIPQAFGKNLIKVKATDVSLNSTVVEFYSERLTSQISNQPLSLSKKGISNSIRFTSPPEDNSTTASDKFILQACIKATTPIKKLMIYRNNSVVNGYLANQIIQKGDCTFMLEETLGLKLGINDLKVEVFTEEDTFSKNITVNYSLYAARNFALLIGNEKYDDPGINELSEPLQDVSALFNTLTQEYNFDPSNVIVLKNSTKAEIIGTLHQLRSKITPTDNFLIFYAGHGYWDEGMGIGYWLPKDAARNNPVNWIPNTDLTNYLSAIKTKHTLLIADACFSGGIFKTRSAFSDTYAIEMLYQLSSRKAITSGTLTVVPDKSVFFQYLIKNLRDNTNDYLSAEELFSKIRIAVINNSANVPQFGTIQNAGDEGGDFIFIKRKR